MTRHRRVLKFARRNPYLNPVVSLSMHVSSTELKTKIIELFDLEGVSPDQIDNDAPLFGPGLGLDSIDALELVVMLEKEYGIVIKDIEEGRPGVQVRQHAGGVHRRPSGPT